MSNDSYINPNNAKRGPFLRSFYETIHAFSLTERVIFYILLVVAITTGLILLSGLNNRFLVAVPDHGGTVTEGVVGVPRFVNPVLAISDADRDLVSLVFSGLLKTTPEGKLIGDLSDSYEISEDGRTYTFTLKDDVFFHDGDRLTTDDIEFTIQRMQDPTVKSPKRPIWDGVSIQKIDSRKISFTLRQAYAPFIENFTVGIIPQHIWKNVPSDEFSFSELNVEAIGSGPYKVDKVKRNSFGLSTYYGLRAFDKYALGHPFVKNIVLYFYQTETELLKAFEDGVVNSMSGVSPGNLDGLSLDDSQTLTSTLPRVFGIFFNQNQASVFLHKEVREALSVAIDRDRIIDNVLFGYATAIDSPVPVKNIVSTSTTATQTTANSGSEANDQKTSPVTSPRVERALTILTNAGWTLNEKSGIMEKKTGSTVTTLSFSVATADAVELRRTAELTKEDWEKIGASVEIKVSDIGDLNQNVIRPRKFDAILFGEVVGRELDLFPFWHSSQRNDPGLNIALYANITADKILENLRLTQDRDEREKDVREFEALFKKDLPAAFVYSPHFIYVVPEKLRNVRLGELSHPGERYLDVHEWFIETNKVWKFFAY